MACSGLKTSDSYFRNSNKDYNSTRKLLNLAFQIVAYVKTMTWGSQGRRLSLKIGLHFGTVIAGVIGHHKPQFSLIGDTVNTTSRVCSTGVENSITLSEEAYNQIKNEKDFKFSLKCVEAKGKGTLNTYQTTKINHKSSNDMKKLEEENKKEVDIYKKESEVKRRHVRIKTLLKNNESNDFTLEKILEKKKIANINKETTSKFELSQNKNIEDSVKYCKSPLIDNKCKEQNDSNCKDKSVLFDLNEDSKKFSLKRTYEKEKDYLFMEASESIESGDSIDQLGKNFPSQKSLNNQNRNSYKGIFEPFSGDLNNPEEQKEKYKKLKVYKNFFLDLSKNDSYLKEEFMNQMILADNKSLRFACFIYILINFIQFLNVILFNFFEGKFNFYFNIVFRVINFFMVLYMELSPFSFFFKRKNAIICYILVILTYLCYNYYNTASFTIISLLELIVGLDLIIKICIYFKEAFFIGVCLLIFMIIYIETVFSGDYFFYPEFIFILTILTLYLYNKRKKQFDSIAKFNEEKHSLNIKNNYDVLITNLLPIHVNLS